MPGHGRGTVDSHLGLPVADVALDVAADWDFASFRSLNDLPMGMTAHIIFSAVGMSPSTQNPDMIKLIRNQIGLEALSGTVAERGT